MNTRLPIVREDRDSVLLVSGDPGMSRFVEQSLRKRGFVAEIVPGEAAGLGRRLLAPGPDIVVLDAAPGGTWGIGVLRDIRRSSHVPVLMLMPSGEESDRIAGLEAGADDCLSRPFHPGELVARLRAVLRRVRLPARGPSPHPPRIVVGDIELDCGARLVRKRGRPLRVTTAEFDILHLLLRNAGCAVSRDELARCALGRPLGPLDRSVDLHVSHLRRKLGPAAGGDGRIKPIRGVGYLYALPPAPNGRSAANPPLVLHSGPPAALL